MLLRTSAVNRNVRLAALATTLFVAAAMLTTTAQAQVFSNQRAVGGVMLDTDGMIRNATLAERGELRETILKALQQVPAELNGRAEMRKVSLKRLDAALRECAASGTPIPDAVQCLAGLQQVRYVVAYPEQNDILLVGPGEGWRVGDDGSIVGETTGKPVLLLDDLVVALRAVNRPEPSIISCSINPSADGRQRLQRFVSHLPANSDPGLTAGAIERELGAQEITIEGIPANSHFAAVLVAADYRMKQMGMGLAKAPVQGLPSFLEMMRLSGRGLSDMMPRWWLEPDYGTIHGDEEGLAWEISSTGVKAMTESDFLSAHGEGQPARRRDPVSEKWAQAMTAKYGDLSLAEPVFGQLQGCMDLAVAATLIVRKDLLNKAECDLPMLAADQPTAELAAPRHVASRAAVARKNRGWLIACGGVQINPWAIVERAETKAELAELRSRVAMASDSGWWSN